MSLTTKNAKGGGNIRRRSDGRWEARYTVGIDPRTGKQISKSVYAKTQKEVRQKLTQILAELDEGTYMEPSKMRLSEWLDIWLAEYLGSVKPRTLATYTGDVKNHIKPALGAVKLSALNPHMVQSFYNDLSRGETPLSPKSVKNIHGAFHKALQQAVTLGYIKLNPADACTLPRIQRENIKPLDETEISAFLEEIKGHKFEIMFEVVLFTGMRQGELLGLTWDCVSFEKGTILIRRQLQRLRGGNGGYHLVSLKNDKPRTITPAPSIMACLRRQWAKQTNQRLLAGCVWSNEKNLVFTNEFGNPIAPQTIYSNFKTIARKIGAPKARFHDLRHTFAVASLQSGDDIKTVQENMGHHTAAFTLDVYGHVTERMKRDSANRMESFIKSVKTS